MYLCIVLYFLRQLGIMKAKDIKNELFVLANPEKKAILQGFFKTGKGEYGEGDRFLGITVPQLRALVKKTQNLPLNEIKILIVDEYHECRMIGLLFLVALFEKSKDESLRREIYTTYIQLVDYINNWDLVDLTAPKIVGAYLWGKNRNDLIDFAKSQHLWLQRIAIVATYYFIKKKEFQATLKIASLLQHHSHDLIHKAVGWMLREVGKMDFEVEYRYLVENKRYHYMPRTMLRYAIEKFPEELRQDFLKGRL